MAKLLRKQKLTFKQKEANNFAWYKEQCDALDTLHYSDIFDENNVSYKKRMKINYDLFNNKIDIKEFNHVCKPYGEGLGELPAKFTNKDIVSSKIKYLLGAEYKLPFTYHVVATNPEATSRREQEEFGKIKEFVIGQIMTPLRQQVEMQKMQENNNGEELTEDDVNRIKQEIEQELQALTPEEVKRYMQRDYQDPAEIMYSQLLEYLSKKCDVINKFNKAYKHGLLSGLEVMYVGIMNGEPVVWNVDSMRFTPDLSPDLDFIEEGDYAVAEYIMPPSKVVQFFDLTDKEIDCVYQEFADFRNSMRTGDLFSLSSFNLGQNLQGIPVIHTVWKSLRKVGFLTYLDEEGIEQSKRVSEEYKLNEEFGDISLEWEWLPENYETWKIKLGTPIYKNMRPIPGQHRDPDNLYNVPLPYYGVVYDNMNSEPTSLMDRLRDYQYWFNIVSYKLELLANTDKGKKVLMNIKALPEGMKMKEWQYFMESSPIVWYNPDEEGGGLQDANTTAKVLDLSYAGKMQEYINILEWIRVQTGRTVGITEQVEGQFSPRESVGNAQQSLMQSSNIVQLYFQQHNLVKRNVLSALIEVAKIAYKDSDKKKIPFIMDDMSKEIINVDLGLLQSSTLGLFIEDSMKAEETKEMLRQLTHAALQNQKVELSDVISVIKQPSIVEAEETLKVAENNRKEFEQNMQTQQIEAQKEQAEAARAFVREEHEMEKEKIILKEEERRKTEIAKNAILGASFNPEVDTDGDGINDFIEILKDKEDVNIKMKKHLLDKEKFEHDKEVDKQKLAIAKNKAK
jgi:hypothetical protein